MDGLYADLERVTRVNLMLEQLGTDRLQPPIANLRPIHTLIIMPHEDIRDVAARHAHELPRPVRWLLRGMGATQKDGLQLLSYLLFESGFTRELIRMGYRDALDREDELRAFLFDQAIGTLDAPQFLRQDLEH